MTCLCCGTEKDGLQSRFIGPPTPNQITGANAGEPRQLLMRTRWAARVGQFWRSAII